MAEYRVEPAKSGKSTCKASKELIEKGELRFGSLVPMGGHGSYAWRKLKCITQKQANNVQAKLESWTSVDGVDDLSAKQKAQFQKAFEAALAGKHDAAKMKAKAAAKASVKAKAKAVGKSKAKVKAKAKAMLAVRKTALKTREAKPSAEEQHKFLDAAKNNEWSKVRELVEKSRKYVNVQPSGRWSVLHQAASAGSAATVKFLVARGASLNVTNSDGEKPYDVAKPNVKALLLPVGTGARAPART